MKTLLAMAALVAVLYQQSIKVDVQLREFTATVRNKQGKIVENLGIKDFVLEENGKTQPIAHVSQDSDTPVSIGLLIDTSASMSTLLPSAVSTAKALVRLMKPDDEFIVMTFDRALHVDYGFSRDRTTIDQQLSRINVSQDGTFLFESVLQAVDQLRKSEIRKRALLLVTDGFPSTRPDLKQVTNAIYESEVLIYTFGFLPGGDAGTAPSIVYAEALRRRTRAAKEVLDLLASASGGQSLALDPAKLRSEKTVKELIAFVQEMAAELRGQYTVGYYPTDRSSPGRKVTIRTLSGNYRVRTRIQ